MNKHIFFLLMLISFISCQNNGNQKDIKAPSTGRFNELLVIIPQEEWETEVGSELKKIIASDVMGLPQPEPQFAIIQIEPNLITGMLKRTRNILKVAESTTTSFDISYDVDARPQVVIKITGDKEALIRQIRENADKLVSTYKTSDLIELRTHPIAKPFNVKTIQLFTKQNFEIHVPQTFEIVDNQDNFVWFRNETYDPNKDINGSKNVIAYTFPLDLPFDQIKDSISVIRNQIGKLYVPGPKEGNYMITEEAYTPHIFNAIIDNKKAYKTYGKWEIKDSFMAGPFISYTVEDATNNRLIVVEGFVYAPMVNKRDFMFELEAIIGTLKIK